MRIISRRTILDYKKKFEKGNEIYLVYINIYNFVFTCVEILIPHRHYTIDIWFGFDRFINEDNEGNNIYTNW